MDKNDLAEIKTLFAETAAKNSGNEEIKDEVVEDEVVDEEIVDEEIEDEVEEEIVEDEEVIVDEETSDEPFSVDSLTKAIDMEVDDFYNVLVPMPDGKAAITIGEMKNTYTQALRDNDVLNTKIAEHEKTIADGTSGREHQQQVSQLEQQAQMEMAVVQNEYNQVDFATLELNDPGQAALMRQKFQERYNNAQNVLQQAGMAQQQEQEQYVQQARSKMFEIVPEWSDKEVFKNDLADMNVAFLDAGYGQPDIDAIVDPIAMKLMHELVVLRKKQAGSSDALKKVRSAPKPLKSKSKRSMPKPDSVKKMVNKAKQSRNKHDQLDAVKALLRVGKG